MATTTSTSTSTSTPVQTRPSGSLHLGNLVKQYPGGVSAEPAVAGIDLDISCRGRRAGPAS